MSEFHPTPAMKRLANALLSGESAPARACPPRRSEQGLQARCKAARISPSTYNSLMASQDFLRWLNNQARERVAGRLWEVRAEHLRLALDGNLQAIKLFYDRYDPDLARASGAEPDDSVAEAFVNLARLAADTPTEDTDEE